MKNSINIPDQFRKVFQDFGFSDFTEQTQLNEELDLLDYLSIVMEIEERFEITLDDSEVDKADTYLKLLTLVENEFNNK